MNFYFFSQWLCMWWKEKVAIKWKMKFNVFCLFSQWITWCTWQRTLLILFPSHFAEFIVWSCCIDANHSRIVRFGDRHRSRATDLILIVFGAAPEYALFTLSIPHITVVIQYQNRISSWRCLVWNIDISQNCSSKKPEREKRKRK